MDNKNEFEECVIVPIPDDILPKEEDISKSIDLGMEELVRIATRQIDKWYDAKIRQAQIEVLQKVKDIIKSMEVAEDENYIFKYGFETCQEFSIEEIDKLIKEISKE